MHETVVFIDDDSKLLMALEQQWLKSGASRPALFFDNAAVALSAVIQLECAVVVAEWTMPEMEGLTLIKRLTEASDDAPGRRFYTIMTTERENGEDAVNVLESGLADYIAKPFYFDALVARIEKGFQMVRREMALRDASATIAAYIEAKAAFVSHLGHELRTPIGAISSLANLLKETALDADQRELVEMIERSGKSTLSILDELLDTE